VANALVGATLGVSCYQWALKAAPSSVVLAFVLEGTRPTPRAMVGAVVAVVGVVVLVRNA
jgi:drug/metabolite transporter (DMT)-like permease